MKKILSALLATLSLTSAAHAEDTILSFRATSVYSSVVTLCATGGFGKVCRVVAAAQDDLHYFVASKGEVRTAQFEEAIRVVREHFQDQTTSDYDLAVSLVAEEIH
ncbi:DUF2388 domain-containing protein [Bdellovibrio sp. HCB2-146]|uniref:DUF2388 domain-containing protein n=1 Tax=Bdellovibrio sp. HCB2-146 TaxID=3394362 RepID=UPI0039BD022A